MSTYFALLTNIGTAKLANAAALGNQLNITKMAVGDGDGVLPTPNPAQTALINEKRRAALNMLSIDPANDSQIIAEQVIPESEGGFWIREIGLYDDNNDLIAIANCPETYKPKLQEGSGRVQTVRMIIVVSSTDAVTLRIDPSVVLATRTYVDNAVIEVKQQLASSVGASMIGVSQGGTVQSAISFLTPEMFGAVGDGKTDDLPAFNKLISFLRASQTSYFVAAYGDYAISDSISVWGMGAALNMIVRSIRPTKSWANPSIYKEAKPLFSIGGNGNMVGLNIRCVHVHGEEKAAWISVIKQGVGGSYFHADRLRGCVGGYISRAQTWPSASNRITGGFWDGSDGIGVWVEYGSGNDTPMTEGTIVDVNFIRGFNKGGVLLRHGAQYSDIRAQFDFNGRHLSELTVNVTDFNGLERGSDVSDGSNTAELMALYEYPEGTFKVLINENHDVSNDGSLFSVGQTLSSGEWSGIITGVRQPSVDKWYPDVIHDFYGAAFAKVKIKSGYLGGLVGGLLHSSNFEYFNSNTALTNGTQGAMWTHSGKILSLRDVARGGAQVLDVSGSYLAPYRHMNMRDYRIFGVEVYAALRKSVVYDVRTFTFAGNGTVSTVREVWRATISCTLDGVSGECLIYVSSSGINIVNNTMNDVTLSVSGMKFQAVQGAQDVLATTFNFQRIF